MEDEKPSYSLRKIKPTEIPQSRRNWGKYAEIYQEVLTLKKGEALEVFFEDGKIHGGLYSNMQKQIKKKYGLDVKIAQRGNKLFISR